jgi:hypothetical protein
MFIILVADKLLVEFSTTGTELSDFLSPSYLAVLPLELYLLIFGLKVHSYTSMASFPR